MCQVFQFYVFHILNDNFNSQITCWTNCGSYWTIGSNSKKNMCSHLRANDKIDYNWININITM